MTQTFADWTAYDDWLIKNYNEFAVFELNENDDHTVTAQYREKNPDAGKSGEGKKEGK